MKKATVLLFSAAIALCAAEPVLSVKLDEGQGTALKTSMTGLTGKIFREKNTQWIDGRSSGSKALAFNAVGMKKDQMAYVQIPLKDQIDFTKPFSIAIWVRVDKAQVRAGQAEIVTNTRSDRGPGFRLTFGWDSINFRTGDGKKVVAASSNPSKNPVERDVWNHCVVTYDGNTGVLYMNGAKAAEAKNFVIAKGNPDLCLGSYNHGSAYGLTGAVSDLRVYNKVLTPKEILAIAKDMEE